jgi:hypothetical protein
MLPVVSHWPAHLMFMVLSFFCGGFAAVVAVLLLTW